MDHQAEAGGVEQEAVAEPRMCRAFEARPLQRLPLLAFWRWMKPTMQFFSLGL